MLPTDSGSTFRETVDKFKPGLAFVVMIFGALIAFEIFNFSTTDHALSDLLGGITFWGLPWSSVLAFAFCGIDFAGIARLFTPEQGADEPKEVWYLFGAWLLAATMNAILTWWGVSMAVANHQVAASAVVDPAMISGIVPVFVAIMVWVIRILIIGSLSLAMDRLLHPGAHDQHTPLQTAFSGGRQQNSPARIPNSNRSPAIPAGLNSSGYTTRPARSASPALRGNTLPANDGGDDIFDGPSYGSRSEPTYHSLSGRPRQQGGGSNTGNGSERYRNR